MRLMYLGDIHGDFGLIGQYIDLYEIKDAHIIQVGDFGVGFNTLEKEKKTLSHIHGKLVKNNVIVWAIRGNHDFKPYFDNDPFGFTNIKLVKDYTVLNLEGKNILCIGGALSIDRKWRQTTKQKNGVFENNDIATGIESWWPHEVFVYDEEKVKDLRGINIIVTHTAPIYCTPDNRFGLGPFVEEVIRETGDTDLKTELYIERKMVTDIFAIVKMNNNITNHYYGHFHNSDVININGTKHRLLGVGELFEERE